jgi:hypothetical protein
MLVTRVKQCALVGDSSCTVRWICEATDESRGDSAITGTSVERVG